MAAWVLLTDFAGTVAAAVVAAAAAVHVAATAAAAIVAAVVAVAAAIVAAAAAVVAKATAIVATAVVITALLAMAAAPMWVLLVLDDAWRGLAIANILAEHLELPLHCHDAGHVGLEQLLILGGQHRPCRSWTPHP